MMCRGRVKTRPLHASAHCANATFNDLISYRLGDLSVEPEEPDDFPDAPLPAPDEPDAPGAPDDPRDPLEDLLLTPNAWAVLSSMVPVMVKPSDF